MALLALAAAAAIPLSYTLLHAQEADRPELRLVAPPPGGGVGPLMPGEPVPGGPGGPHPGAGPRPGGPVAFTPEMVERMGGYIGLVGRMGDTFFNPRMAALVAIAGLRDDVRRKPDEAIKDLEETLAKTKTLGLRNAIRIMLRDLYKAQNDDAKVLEHLKAMLVENDADIQAHEKAPKEGPAPK